jgi:nucleoside-diphosphate-sugar epimerase
MAEALQILLIGGSGFLGPHVAAALRAAGHRVTVMTRGRRALPDGVECLVADRADPASLARALEGRRFDLTVDFLVFDAADIEALLLVPYAALGRYVMISTGQVYLVTEGAKPPYREDDVDGPVRAEPEVPDSNDHASWVYGTGKRRAERTLLGLRGTHGVRATILRPPILQGENDGSLRLWAYLERMLDGGPLVLPDGGSLSVRFLHAADLARAIARVAVEPPRAAAYNLAQPDVIPLREFLERAARAAGVEPRFVEASWEECRAAGLDEMFSPLAGKWRSLLDPSRVATEWGFVAARTEDYLPAVVRWHLERKPASHPGYALRAQELALADRLAGAPRGDG